MEIYLIWWWWDVVGWLFPSLAGKLVWISREFSPPPWAGLLWHDLLIWRDILVFVSQGMVTMFLILTHSSTQMFRSKRSARWRSWSLVLNRVQRVADDYLVLSRAELYLVSNRYPFGEQKHFEWSDQRWGSDWRDLRSRRASHPSWNSLSWSPESKKRGKACRWGAVGCRVRDGPWRSVTVRDGLWPITSF